MTAGTRPKVPPARRAALDVLRLTLDRGFDLQEGLDHVLASTTLSEPDRALTTELVYGYLRFKGRIEFLLSLFLTSRRTPPKVLRSLGLAAYELLFLDRIPAYASVNWAVDAVRSDSGPGPAKMANAVLRRVADLAGSADDPSLYGRDDPSPALLLSRFHSMPQWVVSLWLDAYGLRATELLLAASLSAPPLGLRVNALRPEANCFLERFRSSAGLVGAAGFGVALSSPPADLHELLASGNVSRQSLAAQEALLALGPDSWPLPIWDGCAGRGGKTFFLAERSIPVLASDVSLRRLDGLRSEGKRLALTVPLFAASAAAPPLKIAPGTVLLDVPCSGLGVLSRRPDIKWKRKPEDIHALVQLQARMLLAAYDILPPGGLIAYVTCTLNPDENERQIEKLLRTCPNLSLVKTYRTDFASPLREFFSAALLRKTGTIRRGALERSLSRSPDL
jgi:16S rRNA (cytosine967-C5)-methyltransferase